MRIRDYQVTVKFLRRSGPLKTIHSPGIVPKPAESGLISKNNMGNIAEIKKIDDEGNFQVRYEGETEFRPVILDKEIAAILIYGILIK
ncbi:MAG TPA: hypothetical protein VKO45_01175 [Methanomicrobiales archaeon]|nr:hypothetical protein [Methanomicrobiales archaeon]